MFAMLLTGCGGGNQGSAEGSQAAAIGQGVAEAESCIKIGVSGTPDLDPAIVNTGSSLIAAINIYDTLIFPSNNHLLHRSFYHSLHLDTIRDLLTMNLNLIITIISRIYNIGFSGNFYCIK